MVAYRLKLSETAKLHNVFHVSKLKRFKGDPAQLVNPLPVNFLNQHPLMQPQQALQCRDILKGSKVINQTPLHWEGESATDATWEDTAGLHEAYPQFTLEDKDVAKTGVIDAEQGVALTGKKNSGNWGSGRRNKGVLGAKYDDFVMD